MEGSWDLAGLAHTVGHLALKHSVHATILGGLTLKAIAARNLAELPIKKTSQSENQVKTIQTLNKTMFAASVPTVGRRPMIATARPGITK